MKTYEYIKMGEVALSFTRLNHQGNILKIVLASPTTIEELRKINFSTIKVYNRGDSELGTYTGYSTIYRYNDSVLELSNDGSIYIEPKEHEYIRVAGGEAIDIQSISAADHVLTITFLEEISGIAQQIVGKTIVEYSTMDEVMNTFGDYNTVYRVNGAVVQLSDDGSEYDPAEEEAKIINALREAKINEMSTTCGQAINAGVDVEINGVSKHFRFTAEDQQNIKAAFDLAAATKMNVPYHADNETCALYTPEEITSVYIAEQTNLTHHQTYFNQLKQYLMSLNTEEAIEAVYYCQPLTGVYLDTYNAMMAQTQAIINAMISGL